MDLTLADRNASALVVILLPESARNLVCSLKTSI